MIAETDEDLKTVLTTVHFNFALECGYNSSPTAITLATRQEFIDCIGMHYSIYSVYAELTQLKNGLLQTLHFDKLARQYPVELWSLLALSKSEQVTSICRISSTLLWVPKSGQRGESRHVIL